MDKALYQIQVQLLCHSEQLLFHPHQEDNSFFEGGRGREPDIYSRNPYLLTFSYKIILQESSENCFLQVLLKRTSKIAIT